LQQLRSQAEAAYRLKADLLANINHELRTPLNAVIGFAELLEQQILGPLGHPRYVDYARMIHGSADHLLRVITEILDLSRSGAGLVNLYLEPIDLAQLVESCARLLERRAAEAGVPMMVESDDAPTIFVDPARLQQAVLNLIANAIKFSPSGHPVTIKAEPHDRGAAIVIADKGSGMNEAELSLAREPFRQVDSSLSRRRQGLGLGLPLANRLVEMHGGTLQIDSKPGRGTIVTIILPERPNALLSSDRRREPPRSARQPQGPRKGSPV
jgi:two-component system cell cycle sensor histidine kinase PleC